MLSPTLIKATFFICFGFAILLPNHAVKGFITPLHVNTPPYATTFSSNLSHQSINQGHKTVSLYNSIDDMDIEDITSDKKLTLGVNRRSVLANALASTCLTKPFVVSASDDGPTSQQQQQQIMQSATPIVTTEELAKKLQAVPTFTIVDPNGVPYAVVGEDAKLSIYFFTSYDEATRILKSAKQSATNAIQETLREENKKRKEENLPQIKTKEDIANEVGINPWVDAQIVSVGLEFATTLAASGKKTGSFFYITPNEQDEKDALNLTQQEELKEGKVPLFYIEDMALEKGEIPVYFQKSQLLEKYRQISGGKKEIPQVQVTELFALLKSMAAPSGGEVDEEKDLKNIVFIPPKRSIQKAQECNKKFFSSKTSDEGKENQIPFRLGQRIIVL